MNLQIIEKTAAGDVTEVTITTLKDPLPQRIPAAGKRLALSNGLTQLTGKETVGGKAFKLKRKDDDLQVLLEEEVVLELTDFFTDPASQLEGSEWAFADESALALTEDGSVVPADDLQLAAAPLAPALMPSLLAGGSVVGMGAIADSGQSTPLTPEQTALEAIKAAASNNNATASSLSLQTFVDAGVSGVNAANLNFILSALNTLSIGSQQVDTAAEVQAIVGAANRVLQALSAGTAFTSTADLVALGVSVSEMATDPENVTLFNSVVQKLGASSFSSVQALNTAVEQINALQAVVRGETPSKSLVPDDFLQLGVTGVTTSNLAIVKATLASRADDGSQTDSVQELQSLVDTVNANIVVTGSVQAGPTYAGVKVWAYDSQGQALGSGLINADGSWRIELPSTFTGNLLFKAVDDNGNAANFQDEVTGDPKSLNVALRALTTIDTHTGPLLQPRNYEVHISPLTEIAALQAGASADRPPADAQRIATAHTLVANALHLSGIDIVTQRPTLTVDARFNAVDGLQPAEKIGLLLTQLSGLDSLNGGDMQASVLQIASNIQPSTGSLNATGLQFLEAGRQAALNAARNAPEQGGVVFNQITTLNKQLLGDVQITERKVEADKLVLSGTAYPGSRITLTLSDGTTHPLTADAQGQFRLELNNATYRANEAFSVQSTDILSGRTTAPVEVPAVDNGAPKVIGFQGAMDDTGASPKWLSNGQITVDHTPKLTGLMPLTLAAGEQLIIYRAVGDQAPQKVGQAVVQGGAWSFQDGQSTVLPDATYRYTARIENAEGVARPGVTSGTFTLVVDTSIPAAPTTTVAANNVVNAAEWSASNGIAVRVDLKPGHAVGDVLTVVLKNGDTALHTTTITLSDANIQAGRVEWNMPTQPAFLDGSYQVVTTLTSNRNGQSSAAASTSVLLDTLAPGVSERGAAPTPWPDVVAPEAAGDVTAIEWGDGFDVDIGWPIGTKAGDTLTIRITDPSGDVRTHEQVLTSQDVALPALRFKVSQALASEDGNYQLQATLTDAAGNESAPQSYNFTLNTNQWTLIQTAAEQNTANDLTLATYQGAGVTGMSAGLLPSINSALNTSAVGRDQVDTVGKIQDIVNAYTRILDVARGQAGTERLSADLASVGVQWGDVDPSAANLQLLQTRLTSMGAEQAGTVAKLQEAVNQLQQNTVPDTVAPTVTNIAFGTSINAFQTPDQKWIHGVGDAMDIQVQFSEKVWVTGVPQLKVRVAADEMGATYLQGSGTNTLTFRYTVALNQSVIDGSKTVATPIDTNGVDILADPLVLGQGAAIADAAGNQAVLTYATATAGGAYLIDAKPPTVTLNAGSPVQNGATATVAADGTVTVRVGISEAMPTNVLDASHLVLSNAQFVSARRPDAISFPNLWDIVLAPTHNLAGTMTLDFSSALTDRTGNPYVQGSTPFLTASFNTLIPAEVVDCEFQTTGGVNGYLNAGDTVQVVLTFDKKVSVTGKPVVNLSVGGDLVQAQLVDYSSGLVNQLKFQYTIASGDNTFKDVQTPDSASIILRSGVTITDENGKPANLAVPETLSGWKVDTDLPAIISAGAADVFENTLGMVYDLNAYNDPLPLPGESLVPDLGVSYALLGTDAALFQIDGVGRLSFRSAPDFENPLDANADNIYHLTLQATDLAGNVSTQALALSVKDVVQEPTAGQASIDLGSLGRLMAPVQVNGKWYYYLDSNADGSASALDRSQHNTLDALFKYSEDGVHNSGSDSSSTYRYATVNNVKVALLTAQELYAIQAQMSPSQVLPSQWGSDGQFWTADAVSAGTHQVFDFGSTLDNKTKPMSDDNLKLVALQVL